MKKYYKWIGLGVLVIIVILAIGRKQGWFGDENGTKVSTEIAELRTIIESVSATGKIQPEVEVKITPYISGEVVELYVIEGQEVKEGDLLAKIDPEIYESNFERAEASLNMQKANLANTRARLAQVKAQFINSQESYKRNQQLWEQKVISAAEWDAAKSSFEVSKAEVDAAKQSVIAAEFTVSSAQASLKEARENLTKTSIHSPTDGTVSRLSVEKGERVAGASQFSAGSEIMIIANLNRMEVNVEVNENDIVRVSLGDTVLIEVDAYLNKKFKGQVTEIATSANTTGVSADQVTNFNVKIGILKDSYAFLIPDEDPNFSPFRPGMSAAVDIQTETAVQVLTVPIQAVTTRADSTGKTSYVKSDDNEEENDDESFTEYIFVFEEGIANMKEVTTGIQDNMYIHITKGLDEGAEVITGPYRAVSKKLENGDEVVKVDKEELFKED